MKRLAVVSTAFLLFVLLGGSPFAYAQQGQQAKPEQQAQQNQKKQQAQQPQHAQQQQQNQNKQQAQQQQHAQQQKNQNKQQAQQQQHAQQQQQNQNKQQAQQQQHAQQQQNQNKQQAQRQQSQNKQQAQQQQHAQQQQQSQNRQQAQRQQSQNRQQAAQQQAIRPAQLRPTQQQQHAYQQQQQSTWQQHRAQNWQSEHRSWQQRGGYNGYRIPNNYYGSYYGQRHSFRVYNQPFMVVGGYPRFQYGGYWFSMIDPYPEYWGRNWYQTDDVYVAYSGDGYYLYNRRYANRPGVAISIPFESQNNQQAQLGPIPQQQGDWQRYRAQNWQSEHRSWQQRGGYNGYRVPDDSYGSYYGPDHYFRVSSLPFRVEGGYPSFQYGGHWFSMIDPYPENWGDTWYQTDDVYVAYSDDGYYLYNRMYPDSPGVAVSISF